MAKENTRISREVVDKVVATLKDAATRPPPRPDSFTMQGVVIEVAPLVRDLQQRGYSLDDIVPLITKAGVSTSTGAMRTYLSRVPGPSPDTRKVARGTTGRRKPAAASYGAVDNSGAGVAATPVPTAPPVVQHNRSRLHEPDPEGESI